MAARIPVIDLATLSRDRAAVVRAVGDACSEYGFFLVRGHGVDPALEANLERMSREFFARPESEKLAIAMKNGGRAWRGYFPVGGELTSGRPDLKEGLYFGTELGPDDPRVRAGLSMHGANLFPAVPGFRETVLAYQVALTALGHRVVGLVAESLGLPEAYFAERYTADPIALFRIFHYPAVTPENARTHPWGVGEHTDYGLLTLLKQDDCGGLEVKTREEWVPVPPEAGTFVCNIGDMLDVLTRGRYRSAPHRVRNLSGRSRYSYPFFFDPGFSARIEPLPGIESGAPREARWDEANLELFRGTYGDYLIGKVAKVFPYLAQETK
ncbi:MAG: isopenicillin N synthase family oxygenase [Bdellovibrionales bacterium]|nr:isopenicillin N synthase family oxygenase [Bdellovibrionales bacterium]